MTPPLDGARWRLQKKERTKHSWVCIIKHCVGVAQKKRPLVGDGGPSQADQRCTPGGHPLPGPVCSLGHLGVGI